MTNASHFRQLLSAALAQTQPQRLLFVFAAAELPDDATAEQRRRFEAGQGGALAPLACVDKSPQEMTGWDALVAEARTASGPWQVVFVAALDGQAGHAPAPAAVDSALATMVENVRQGRFRGYLALDTAGEPLTFS